MRRIVAILTAGLVAVSVNSAFAASADAPLSPAAIPGKAKHAPAKKAHKAMKSKKGMAKPVLTSNK